MHNESNIPTTQDDDPLYFLHQLNPQQREAVTTIQGPLLVLAGAGSGKTRVLTYRIAYLLAKGVDPSKILALTFTNKAANEMKERVVTLTSSEQAKQLWMGTFHSIFLRILRLHAPLLHFTPTFSVYDTSASQTLLKRIVKELIPPECIEYYRPRVLLSRISLCKNNLLLPAAYAQQKELMQRDQSNQQGQFLTVYTQYQEQLKKLNSMDFDDILLNTLRLLRQHKEVLQLYRQQFQYLLVDEYQDTNQVQSFILRLLAQEHTNLCVVGDDAQSIYAFRGANLDHILKFTTFFPKVKTVKLTLNYRSYPPIVDAANRLIQYNERQIPKVCEPFQKDDDPDRVRYSRYFTAYEEATAVADDIAVKSLQYQLLPSQFAILYRTNAQSRLLENALRKRDIPYTIYGGLSFYDRQETTYLLSYFRSLVNPLDTQSLFHIINFPPRQIGDKTQMLLQEAVKHLKMPLWKIIEQAEKLPLPTSTKAKIIAFRSIMQPFLSQVNAKSAFEVAKAIYEKSGIKHYYEKDNTVEGESRLANLSELLNDIQEKESDMLETGATDVFTLAMYLDDAALQSPIDQEEDSEEPTVTLTTVHSAKGLEFDYVYVVGMVHGIFPSFRALNEPQGMEEERRLCYVAVTRAAKGLTLSLATQYSLMGRIQNFMPSPFLAEMNPNYSKNFYQDTAISFTPASSSYTSPSAPVSPTKVSSSLRNKTSIPRPTPPQGQFTIHPSEITPVEQLHLHDRVLHSRFGEGVIESLSGEGVNKKAVVQFTVMGKRTLMLHYAKLKKLT